MSNTIMSFEEFGGSVEEHSAYLSGERAKIAAMVGVSVEELHDFGPENVSAKLQEIESEG